MSSGPLLKGAPAPSHDSDGQLLTVAGFVLGIALLQSLFSQANTHVWEPQGLILRQWFAVGVLITPYVLMYALDPTLLLSWRARLSRSRRVRTATRLGAFPISLFRKLWPRPLAVLATLVLVAWSVFAAPTMTDRMLVWLALLALASPYAVAPEHRPYARRIVACVLLFAGHCVWQGMRVAARSLLACVFLGCAAWLVISQHRHMAIVLGVAQTVILARFVPLRFASPGQLITLTAVSIGSWALTMGFTFTPLDQWLLGATESTAFGFVAFAVAFGLVLLEFGKSNEPHSVPGNGARRAVLLLSTIAFMELGLRTDHLLSDWLPYHRTFWVAPADFIRQGAWALWDYPSQYGVLSELSIALWPSHSTWQALYLETAFTLAAVSVIIFIVFRQRRCGVLNVAFALAATCAVVYSSQGGRYPMGWRLYPQLGLRFQFVIAIFGIAYLLFVNREHSGRRKLGYIAGNTVWSISLAWSFECGLFASCAWFAFVAVDFLINIQKRRGLFRRFIAAFAPLALVPVALYLATELVFRVCRGHGPDWASYIEFSAAYQREGSGIIMLTPSIHGTVWMIALVLIGIASVAVAVVRQRRYECLPVIAACWFGVWGASIYFVGETIEVHANGLAPVFAAAVAVVFALQRAAGGSPFVTLPVRAALAPFFVILIAYAFGEPTHILSIRAPFMRGFSMDSIADFPAISGELADTFARAGVLPTDDVVLPIPYLANKLGIGLTLPFMRGANGQLYEQTAWLPISPIGPFNAMFTLPYERRQTYLRRYMEDVKRTGWFATYHRPADCTMLLPDLFNARTVRSKNYEVSLCTKSAVPVKTPHVVSSLRSGRLMELK